MLKLALICALVSIVAAGKLHTTPFHIIKSSELSSNNARSGAQRSRGSEHASSHTQHASSQAQHASSHTQHDSSHAQHASSHTQHDSSHSQHASSHSSQDHNEEAHATILKLYSDVRSDGFEYEFDTSNHIHAEAAGDKHGNIHGEFEYISHEGIPIKLDYVADEHGYQPHSDILPTPPPIPDGILKALAYIHSHPNQDEDHYDNHHANHGHGKKH